MTTKKAKILIVDDNRAIREVLRGVIRHDDTLHVVGTAANGDSALEMIGSLHPDLVCLDVLMPGLDGVDVLRRIHRDYKGTRVVMITGESRLDVVQGALRAGASGFVVKPFNADKILRTIHTALKAPVPECQPEPEPEPPEAEAGAEGAAEGTVADGEAAAPADGDTTPDPEHQAAA